MLPFESFRSIAGSSPETWRAGTSMLSVTEQQTEHTHTELADGTRGSTYDYTYTAQSSYVTSRTYAPSSFGEDFTEDIDKSVKEEHNFTPSTYTEFVPAWTTPPTSAASTATITANYTESTISHSFDKDSTRISTGDTSGHSSYAESTGRTVNGVVDPPASDWEGNPIPTTTVYQSTFTHAGANTIISSLASTVDSWTTKTVSTNTEAGVTWQNTAWTTASHSISLSTNSTQTATSSSSWSLHQGTTVNTSHSTSGLTTPVTYAADSTTYHTRTVLFGTETQTWPVTTETVTEHAYVKLIDTIVLMRGGRDSADFTLGDMLWWFSLSSLAATASVTGRMSDLFTSTGAATVTLSDYSRYTSNSIAITEVTMSENTVATTTTTVTGTPPATGTATTGATVHQTSKNGALWKEYETCTTTLVTGTPPATGTVATTGFSDASSNTSTDSHTFSIGSVGTSVSTWTYGDPASTESTTIFTHSIQVTGYSDFTWTSATTTEGFASSSFTESRLALHSSTSSAMDIVVRSTTTDAALIDSYSSYLSGTDTSHFHLGKVTTATTRVFEVATTSSRSLWDSHFNQEVRLWTSQTTYTLPGGDGGSTSGVSEFAHLTHHSEYRVLPQIRTTPDGLDVWRFTEWHDLSLDVARHQVPPFGYAGFGGSFAASALQVYFSVSANLVSGSAFGTSQSINPAALPTMSAYSGVTMFPVQAGLALSIEGAAAASYISSLASIGTASIAVTWTSTTNATSGTGTIITSSPATYALAGSGAIAGSFYSEEAMTVNSSGGFFLIGGHAIGENALGHSYQVRCRSGFAAWTEFKTSESSATLSFSTSSSAGTVSFSVPASHAIVFSIEPVFTANWTGGGEVPFYFSSTPHVPFA